MSEIKQIESYKIIGNKINAYEYNSKIYFRASDIGKLLGTYDGQNGFTNVSTLTKNLNPDDKIKTAIEGESKKTKILFITERGLLTLIMSSKTDLANEIRMKITDFVVKNREKTEIYLEETEKEGGN